MAMIVSFVNVSGLNPLSDYEVNVWINTEHIAGPFTVYKHQRKDGWKVLLDKFVKELNNGGTEDTDL